jgi:hypothetical protein
MRRWSIVTSLAAAAVAASACSKTVDTKGYEKSLAADFEKRTGLTGATASCPRDIAAKVGVKFTCKITVEGVAYDFNAEITGVDGDDVAFSTGFARGTAFPKARLLTGLAAEVEKQAGVAPTIDCGAEPLLFPTDGDIVCAMTVGPQRGEVRVETEGTDVKGWKFAPQ